MHYVGKMHLVVMAAFATLAFAAPAADAMEVSAEDGSHCPEIDASNAHVVNGGCVVEAESSDHTPGD